MHELATTRNLVSICEDAAAKEGFKHVKEIRLHIGQFSGIEAKCLQDFFPYASAGTVCEGAALVCEEVPGEIVCDSCGYVGQTTGHVFDCPRCGGSIRLTKGREFFVDSLAVE